MMKELRFWTSSIWRADSFCVGKGKSVAAMMLELLVSSLNNSASRFSSAL
jgi:hypothetical protein